MKTAIVSEQDVDIRLNKWFERHMESFSISQFYKCLRQKNIKVNNKKVSADYKLSLGDEILYPDTFGVAAGENQTSFTAKEISSSDKEWLQSLVIYKDRDMLAINKPSGLAVQGGSGQIRFLDRFLDALDLGTGKRPKLVHRLDKDTSGVLLLARNDLAATWLTRMFKERDMHKTYIAIVEKRMKAGEGTIKAAIKKGKIGNVEMMIIDKETGLEAITKYEVLSSSPAASLVKFQPKTGRTHQLRIHAKYMGHPILGDIKYGSKNSEYSNLKLHLHALSIEIPTTKGIVKISAPLPDYMRQTIEKYDLQYEDNNEKI